MPYKDFISVIVPVYNGAQTLTACLEALQHQTRPPDEIIIVDDGSTDSSVAIASKFDVITVSQPNAGPAAARNYGARLAQGDILLFTDADCAPAANWVEQMLSPFSDPSIVGAKGEYRTRQQELTARFVQQEYQDRCDRMIPQSQIDFVDTYSAAYRREVFLEVDGFDVNFPYAEDAEFSFRLTKLGYRLVYIPGAIVYHQHDRTIGEYFRRKYWMGYWRTQVMFLYPAKLMQDSHTPQILKIQIALMYFGGLLLIAGILSMSWLIAGSGLLTWLILLVSGLSFYTKVSQRDTEVLLVAPLFLWIRAGALGAGFLFGTFRSIWTKFKKKPSEEKKRNVNTA